MSERLQLFKRHHANLLWTRFGTIFLGLWLLASPETFGYTHEMARYSDWISGILLIVFGLISMSYRHSAWIWGGCFVGLWLQFAPLIFWAKDPAIYVNSTLIGVLAIAFCVLVPLRPKELELGPTIPPGWTYNPSSWHQRIPVIFFAMVGWFIARYLASFQLGYITSVWDPFFGDGTEKVITSTISQDFPVADAGLGALAYSLEAIMGAKGSVRRWHTMPWLVVFFGILVVPVGFVSIVLVMLQPIAVGAWCGLCLIIAVCMLIMLSLSVDEVVAVLQFLGETKREGRPLWRTFWQGSRYTEEAVDVRTPSFDAPLSRNVKAMFWGITIPWNLVITALIGVWLLFSEKFLGNHGLITQNTDVCGALIVTFSLISFAEVIRAARFINVILGAWFALAAFVLPGATGIIQWHSVIVAALVIVLSLFRGRIREHYGHWDSKIF